MRIIAHDFALRSALLAECSPDSKASFTSYGKMAQMYLGAQINRYYTAIFCNLGLSHFEEKQSFALNEKVSDDVSI